MEIDLWDLNAVLWPNSVWKSNILKAIDLVLGESWTTKGKVSRELFYDPQNALTIEVYFKEPVKYFYYSTEKQIRCASIKMTCSNSDYTCESRLWENSFNDNTNRNWGYYVNDEFKRMCHFVYIPSQRDLSDQMRVASWTMLWKMMREIYNQYSDFYGTDIEWTVNRSEGEKKMKEEFTVAMESSKVFLEKEFSVSALNFKKFHNTFVSKCKKNAVGMANDFHPSLDIYDVNWFYKTLQISITEDWQDGKQFNVEEVWSWMQNIILLSIFQTYAELMGNKVIFWIEEPELFLYPHAQRALYESFKEISTRSQIIYTTHNPNFLDAKKPETLFILRKTKEEGTFLLPQKSQALSLDASLKALVHFKNEQNEIFFANRVVLVEWESDKVLFENLCKKWSINIDELGVSIIQCCGKTGVVYFVGVCYLLWIDYFWVWDKDATKKNWEISDIRNHLARTQWEGRWIEMVDNLEEELHRIDTTYNKYADKVKNAFVWSQAIQAENIPDIFTPIKKYIEDGSLIAQSTPTTSRFTIEDIPF